MTLQKWADNHVTMQEVIFFEMMKRRSLRMQEMKIEIATRKRNLIIEIKIKQIYSVWANHLGVFIPSP